MAPALSEGFSETLLGMPKAVHELTVARRFFDRIQIGALNVLNDSDFKDFCIIQLPHKNGNRVQLGDL